MRPSRRSFRLGGLLGPAWLAVVAAAFLFLLVASNGPVRIVKVSGELTAAERAEVRQAVVAALDSSYLTLDLDAVVGSVLALSWPHGVRVRRTFPAGVAVQVNKEVFVARWGGGGVLNSEGEVITTPDGETGALPLLDCAVADGARAMQVYQALAGVLAGHDLHVAAARENAIGEWTLEFDNALRVALGAEDMLGRLERFLTVYDRALVGRLAEVASVDARYTNGIAVDWRERAEREPGSIQLAALSGAMAMDH